MTLLAVMLLAIIAGYLGVDVYGKYFERPQK